MQIPAGNNSVGVEDSHLAGKPIFLQRVVLIVLASATVAAWIVPAHKQNAVYGRLNYSQFWLAVVLTAAISSVLAVVLAPVARRRAVGFRLGAVWFGLALALLGTELTAWLWPVRHQMDNPWYLSVDGGVSASDELPFERPSHLKWHGLSRGDLALMNGDEDPYARMVTFKTDMDGFHNSQDIRQADLIAIGDSYLEAGNLPEEDNFLTLTGQKLGIKSRNLGRAGYTTPTELIVLKKYGLRCQPKIVVWQIAESNDLADSVMYEKWVAGGRKNFFDFFNLSKKGETSRSEVWQRRSPTYRLFSLLRDYKPPIWSFAGIFKDRDGVETFVRFPNEPAMRQPAKDHPGWETFSSALAEGAALCRSNNIQLVVVLIPMKYKVLGPYMQMPDGMADYLAKWPGLREDVALDKVLRPFCAALGVSFIDATASLKEKAAASNLVYLPYDTHLNSLGHQVVADLIVETLKKDRQNGPATHVVAEPAR